MHSPTALPPARAHSNTAPRRLAGVLLATALAATGLLSACASSDGASASDDAQPPTQTSSATVTGTTGGENRTPPPPVTIDDSILDQAADDDVHRTLLGVRDGDAPYTLIVHCARPEAGIRNVEMFESGVAVWKADTQIQVGSAVRRALVEAMVEARFHEMRSSYGGKPAAEAGAKKAGAPLTIHCRITFESDGITKTSVQQIYGEQSEAMMGLATDLLDLLEPLAAEGVTAEDLGDGLSKLAEGNLAPEMLEVRFVRLPGRGQAGPGFILRAEDGSLIHRPYQPGKRVGEAESRPLEATTFERLVGALLAADFPALPRNLHATDQLEVEARVLGHHHAVLARDFTGMDRDEADGDQVRFDDLVAVLNELAP